MCTRNTEMCLFVGHCRALARSAAEKLRRKLLRRKGRGVPEDVKEGQFAVYAVDGGGLLHRFVADLECLARPSFLRLLEMAADEFGLERPEGVLVVPCEACELREILAEQQHESKDEKTSV